MVNQLALYDDDIKVLAQKAVYAMLLETACHPSPGLVNPRSAGSHKDMNYYSFLASSSTLAPYFILFAQIGKNLQGEPSTLLTKLRQLGITAEKELFEATGGVNTQKGLLFSLGLSVGSAGYSLGYSINPTAEEVRRVVRQAALPLWKELHELKTNKRKPITNGEMQYIQYGVMGIRGEVIRGFPSVFHHGLPELKRLIKAGYCVNDCLVGTLIKLMAVVEDTTIIGRKGLAGLEYVQSEAQEAVILGAVDTLCGREKIMKMEKDFIKQGLSPGGAADLLAVTVFFYLLDNDFCQPQIIRKSVFAG
jgi:triphosphoribosyl-dephospho-CoA synthase CitG